MSEMDELLETRVHLFASCGKCIYSSKPDCGQRLCVTFVLVAKPFRRSSTNHLQIIYRSFPLHDLDISRQIDDISPVLYGQYDLYDLAHVAGWDPYDLHDLK